MPRRNLEQLVAAAQGALVDGERVIEYGTCWAARRRRRVPLLLLARRQFLLVLTDRRLLLFTRRGSHASRPSDLVIGKRYETFSLDRVRRARLLLQVLVQSTSDDRMVFEFRPRRRHLGEALVHRLDPRGPAPVPAMDQPAPTMGQPAAAAASDDDAAFWEPPPRGT